MFDGKGVGNMNTSHMGTSKPVRFFMKIGHRMILTYPHRRRLINQKVTLAEIKLQYLALFSFSEITIYLIDL